MGGGGEGTVGREVMTPRSWSLMNKVTFLGSIISKSKRFTSILIPDFDSTAKSYFRNNVLNIVRWFITKFCPSQSCLPCHNLSRHIFGAVTPKIEIAVQNMKKTKTKNKKTKVEIVRIFTFHQYQLPHKIRKN